MDPFPLRDKASVNFSTVFQATFPTLPGHKVVPKTALWRPWMAHVPSWRCRSYNAWWGMGGREAGQGELAVVWQVEWTNYRFSKIFCFAFCFPKRVARKEVAIASFTFPKAANRYVRLGASTAWTPLQVCPNGQIFLLAVWTLIIPWNHRWWHKFPKKIWRTTLKIQGTDN